MITKEEALNLWVAFCKNSLVSKEQNAMPSASFQFHLDFNSVDFGVIRLTLQTKSIGENIHPHDTKRLSTPYGFFDLTFAEAMVIRGLWEDKGTDLPVCSYDKLMSIL